MDGYGVDVVYDLVGGSVFEVLICCIVFEGWIVVIGFVFGMCQQVRFNYVFVKNYMIFGLYWSFYFEYILDFVWQCYDELFGLVVDGWFELFIVEVVGFEDVFVVFGWFIGGGMIGWIVVCF